MRRQAVNSMLNCMATVITTCIYQVSKTLVSQLYSQLHRFVEHAKPTSNYHKACIIYGIVYYHNNIISLQKEVAFPYSRFRTQPGRKYNFMVLYTIIMHASLQKKCHFLLCIQLGNNMMHVHKTCRVVQDIAKFYVFSGNFALSYIYHLQVIESDLNLVQETQLYIQDL